MPYTDNLYCKHWYPPWTLFGSRRNFCMQIALIPCNWFNFFWVFVQCSFNSMQPWNITDFVSFKMCEKQFWYHLPVQITHCAHIKGASFNLLYSTVRIIPLHVVKLPVGTLSIELWWGLGEVSVSVNFRDSDLSLPLQVIPSAHTEGIIYTCRHTTYYLHRITWWGQLSILT